METAIATTKVATKKPKIKLDFKDSKYATGRRKNLGKKRYW
jgi:small subunit ribosomal protein S9